MENKPFIEALKELGRLAIFALPGAGILFLTSNPEAAGAWGILILFVLRAIDKGIHEDGNINAKGLVPF